METKIIDKGSYATVLATEKGIIKKSIDSFKKILTSEVREAAFLKQYTATFLPAVHSIDIIDNRIQITMEDCGISLRNYIEKGKPKNIISKLVLEMLKILSTLESNKIVHGDLSDGNIMIKCDPSNNIKIIDWGTVIVDIKNTTLERGCTPFCRAPELYDKMFGTRVKSTISPLTTKSDIYSFGKVLLWMVTEKDEEFKSKRRGGGGRSNKLKRGDILKLREFGIDKIVAKMLITDPEERPSARRLLQLFYPDEYSKITIEKMRRKKEETEIKEIENEEEEIKCKIEDICWVFDLDYVEDHVYFYMSRYLTTNKNTPKGSVATNILIYSCIILADMMHDSIIDTYRDFIETLEYAEDKELNIKSEDLSKSIKDIVKTLDFELFI